MKTCTPNAFNTRQLLIYGVTGLELVGIVNRGCINLASKVSPTGPLLLIFLLASTRGEVYRYQVDSSTARVWDTQCWKSWIVSSLDKDVRESSCLSLSVSINKWINYRELYSPPGPQREDVQLVHLTWEKWNCKNHRQASKRAFVVKQQLASLNQSNFFINSLCCFTFLFTFNK